MKEEENSRLMMVNQWLTHHRYICNGDPRILALRLSSSFAYKPLDTELEIHVLCMEMVRCTDSRLRRLHNTAMRGLWLLVPPTDTGCGIVNSKYRG